ncbi:uncharacterized protein LOC109804713 [Cajanus cajan]|uniref:PARP catalytic domain-containing protein n=1 Tax=Cajanus cajan TaxID=3821 RepID=A0A151T2L0_CAJCA|nr:uncharacterized protein LOC109804713 [Cajanus cajan]KYP61221.1 hypothetical protein KK1_023649 [Cajanus cajan]
MSEIWHLVKKSLHCKPQSSEVHDPKASRGTHQRKKIDQIDSSNEENQRHSERRVSHEVFLDRSSGEIMICPCCPCSQGHDHEDGNKPHPPRSTCCQRIIYSSKAYCVDCHVFSKSKVPLEKDCSSGPPSSIRHHECEEKLQSTDFAEQHDDNIAEHSVIQLERESSSCKIIEQICQGSDMNSESKIECVLRVENKKETFACFEECREMVRVKAERVQNDHPRCLVDGNELLRFHGTTIACSLGSNASSTLCTLDECGVCQILRHGFSANQEFHGSLGVYTTSTSAKAIDSICITPNNNFVMRKSVMVCKVIAGKIYNPLQEIKEMTDPGFDSLVKKILDQSEIEELIVLNPRAVLPCFLVIYNF